MARPKNPIGCHSHSWKVLNKFPELKAELKVASLKFMKLKRREAKLKLKIESAKHAVFKLDVIEVLNSEEIVELCNSECLEDGQKVRVPMWIKGYEFKAIADKAKENLFNLVKMNSKRKRN